MLELVSRLREKQSLAMSVSVSHVMDYFNFFVDCIAERDSIISWKRRGGLYMRINWENVMHTTQTAWVIEVQ